MRLLGKDEHPVRLTFLAATLSLVYLTILLPNGFLEAARLRSSDAYFRWRSALTHPPAESSDLLLVTVDEESQRLLGKKWPWERSLFAEFLNKLSESEPRLVALDFVFSGTSDPENDNALAQAIRSGPPVLLASYLDRQGDPVLPHELFTQAGGKAGLINHPRDIDLTVRRLFAGIALPLHPEPLLTMEVNAAALYQHLSPDQVRLESRSSKLRLGSRTIPLEPPIDCIGINYFLPQDRIATVSFWQVMEGRVRPEQIRGKIVLVGSTREITHDVYPTPLGLMPGVTISANGILTLLTGKYVRSLPLLPTLLLGFLFVLSILLMTYWMPLPWASLATAGLALLGAAAGFLAVLWFNLRTEWLSVFILAGSAWLAAIIYKYLLLFSESVRLHRNVLTDPISGAVTERYFRLRLDTDWPRLKRSRRPSSMLVLRMDPIPYQLQQAPWPDVQGRLTGLTQTLRHHLKTVKGSLTGRLSDDRFAVFLPGFDLAQAKPWAETARDSLQSTQGHLSFGLACTQQATAPSVEHLILAAGIASGRSWNRANRPVEVFDPEADRVVLPNDAAQGEQEGSNSSGSLGYVALEMEDRNRAVEKALNELRHAHKEMESHFLEVTKSLVMTMDTKDAYTAGHLERVSRYATRLAEALQLPKEEIEAVREAALLHDIGKLNLPEEVLHKTGTLTPEEVEVIKKHLELGAKILDPMKFFRPITTVLYHHHERYDGKGYPHGLIGEFIPPGAQIITIADSFDAMTTHRGYNKPKNVQEAVEELRRGSGTQFNPQYVEAFIKIIQAEGPHLAGYTAR